MSFWTSMRKAVVLAMRDDEAVASFEGVTCKKMTDKALLVEIGDEEVWIPLSHVHDDSEVFDDGANSNGRLVVTEWIAKQKGLL